jgi:hypothetical protein
MGTLPAKIMSISLGPFDDPNEFEIFVKTSDFKSSNMMEASKGQPRRNQLQQIKAGIDL